MVRSETTIPKIVHLLNHLFTAKNLKPATIADYRTATADRLGHVGQEVRILIGSLQAFIGTDLLLTELFLHGFLSLVLWTRLYFVCL